MAEFMDMGSGYGSQTTEIYLKRVLAGNVESVRPRLAAALERVGYDLIEDEPELRARRGARGWGTWYGSADVLDYAMELVVRLKPVGAHSTRATFDYAIKHPWLSGGEKEVLAREAAAITALATMRAADKICAACGTESTDDSRFCRRCGAPMTAEQADFDVLRMTAETRAGHTSVVASAVMLIVTNLMSLAVLIAAMAGVLETKGLRALAIIGGIIGFLNLLASLFAWKRLNRALKPKRDQASSLNVAGQASLSSTPQPWATALPPTETAAHGSITEGTTELLDMRAPERVAVPVRRGEKEADTLH